MATARTRSVLEWAIRLWIVHSDNVNTHDTVIRGFERKIVADYPTMQYCIVATQHGPHCHTHTHSLTYPHTHLPTHTHINRNVCVPLVDTFCFCLALPLHFLRSQQRLNTVISCGPGSVDFSPACVASGEVGTDDVVDDA